MNVKDLYERIEDTKADNVISIFDHRLSRAEWEESSTIRVAKSIADGRLELRLNFFRDLFKTLPNMVFFDIDSQSTATTDIERVRQTYINGSSGDMYIDTWTGIAVQTWYFTDDCDFVWFTKPENKNVLQTILNTHKLSLLPIH